MVAHALHLTLNHLQFPNTEPLFKNLNLSIPKGEFTVLMGPSGIGKSTLLRVIAGLIPFNGTLQTQGHPGFMFQDARLLPWLTAAQNLTATKPDLDAPQVETLLTKVGLQGQSALKPRQMSGGMQRRLALARALATGSGLLLLDEPFASLDAPLANEMRAQIQTLHRAEAPTILMASHDPEDAKMADRTLHLSGRPARLG